MINFIEYLVYYMYLSIVIPMKENSFFFSLVKMLNVSRRRVNFDFKQLLWSVMQLIIKYNCHRYCCFWNITAMVKMRNKQIMHLMFKNIKASIVIIITKHYYYNVMLNFNVRQIYFYIITVKYMYSYTILMFITNFFCHGLQLYHTVITHIHTYI